MLSLVSAPVLGFDLVRHPHGDAIATVLLRALAVGPAELPAFAAERDRIGESELSAALADVRAAGEAGAPALTTGRPVDRDGASLADVITELHERMIFELSHLEALVREDVLAWCGPYASANGPLVEGPPSGAVTATVARAAGDTFVNAIASLWARGPASVSSRRLLAAGFLEAGRVVPWRDPDIGPNAADIRALLGRLRGTDSADRARLRAATAILRPSSTTEWAAAMHEASWAALTTGRVRAAAAAQLLAVRAYAGGGFDATDGSEGVWNVISGAVHAGVVADVLPDDLARRLTEIWRTVYAAR